MKSGLDRYIMYRCCTNSTAPFHFHSSDPRPLQTNLCLSTLESCYPYTSGDTSKTGTYQKTCKLELIDYLLCNGTE